MVKSRDYLLLAAITAIAVAARFYGIDQTPPGLHFDEAFEAVQALDVVSGRAHPVFFEGNYGVEPTLIYLVALFFRLFGVSHLAGRLVAAFVGALTVPALYLLVRTVFARHRGEVWASRLGLLSSLTLAVLYWHVHFSRLGIEPILVPLNATMVLYFLWRAIATGKTWAFVACGAAVGFGPYTYPAGRLLPILALGVGLHALLARPEGTPSLRQRPALKIGAAVLAAVLVLLPLAMYFHAHPSLLMQRVGQVSATGGEHTLGGNLWATVRMLNFAGDQDPRNNLPGRPVLDPAWSVLFCVGLLVCLARIRRPEYGLPLWWMATLLAPTVLSEYAPHFRRALGASPAVAVLIALGGVWVAETAARVTRRGEASTGRIARPLAAVLLVAGLWLFGGVSSVRDYFGRWARLPALYYAFDVGLKDIADWIRALPLETAAYLTPVRQDHQTVIFEMGMEGRPKTLDGRRNLVLPPAGQPAAYVNLVGEDNVSAALLKARMPDLHRVAQFDDWASEPYAYAWLTNGSGEQRIEPGRPLEVRLGDTIGLIGADVPARAEPGHETAVTLYWRALARSQRNYTAFVHLLGAANPGSGKSLWAQEDSQPGKGSYPTDRWSAGETIIEEYRLPIPHDAPPGEYSVHAGMYLLETLERLPVEQNGQSIGDAVILGSVRVETSD